MAKGSSQTTKAAGHSTKKPGHAPAPRVHVTTTNSTTIARVAAPDAAAPFTGNYQVSQIGGR